LPSAANGAGIIASASYEARKFGVYTPMPTVRSAQALPEADCPARQLRALRAVLELDVRLTATTSRPMWSRLQLTKGYFDLSGTRKPPVGYRAEDSGCNRPKAENHGQ
jgi:DNA polymerase-4